MGLMGLMGLMGGIGTMPRFQRMLGGRYFGCTKAWAREWRRESMPL